MLFRSQSTHSLINGVSASVDGAAVADLAKSGALVITLDHNVSIAATDKPVPVNGAARPTSKAVDPSTVTQPITVSTLRQTLGLSAGSQNNQKPSSALASSANGTGVVAASSTLVSAPSTALGLSLRT